MKTCFSIIATALLFISCEKAKEAAQSALNKGGETVGKSATEFVEGVTEGVDRTLDCDITFSKELKDEGLKNGKYSFSADSVSGQTNKMTLYIIFNKDFDKKIGVKVFDKKGLETGRTSAALSAKAGEAKYYDFTFDPRTNIEARSKIVIE